MQIAWKKIIFVVPSLSGGGAERVASILHKSLHQSDPGLEIILVLFQEEPTDAIAPNTRVLFLNVHAQGGICYRLTKFVRVIHRLYQIFTREAPCVILSFMDYSNIVSLIANRLAGRKNRLVISVHTRPSAQTRIYASNILRVVGWLIPLLYNQADAVVAVTRDVGEDLAKNFRVDGSRVRIINNPIPIEKIRRLSGEAVSDPVFHGQDPVILYVGRLSREKGVDILVRAFARVRRKAGAKLVIVGEGNEEKTLRQLTRDLGIEAEVFFLGYKDNPYTYMRCSTVFVLPSHYEGLSTVIIESMACGVPVVSTRSFRDIEEIVEHGKAGLLVDVGDEQAIAEAVLNLLNNGGLRNSMAEEARKKIGAFSVEKITDQYKAVLTLS
jgi:glycosyltransferase involved in cell wall biosynthesis